MFSHNPRQWQADSAQLGKMADSAQLGKMADSGFKERGTVAADWTCAVWMGKNTPAQMFKTYLDEQSSLAGRRERKRKPIKR
jgi:hypothetical protein